MLRPDWDTYFGLMCQVIAIRSDDTETKLGAVIVDKKNTVVSTGYNGTPRGTDLPKTRPDKYPYMEHAERNAIYFARRNLEGCTVYIYKLYPCSDCARAIIQNEIKEVVVVNNMAPEGSKVWNQESAQLMFTQAKITVRNIEVPKLNLEEVLK